MVPGGLGAAGQPIGVFPAGTVRAISQCRLTGPPPERSKRPLSDDPEGEFPHHGDRTIPPEQRFSGFARSAILPDGQPSPIMPDHSRDRLGLLEGATTFNLHPHLPQLGRLEEATEKLDVLARQRVDPEAPPHPLIAD
jgi:hypothetical protein